MMKSLIIAVLLLYNVLSAVSVVWAREREVEGKRERESECKNGKLSIEVRQNWLCRYQKLYELNMIRNNNYTSYRNALFDC